MDATNGLQSFSARARKLITSRDIFFASESHTAAQKRGHNHSLSSLCACSEYVSDVESGSVKIDGGSFETIWMDSSRL